MKSDYEIKAAREQEVECNRVHQHQSSARCAIRLSNIQKKNN